MDDNDIPTFSPTVNPTLSSSSTSSSNGQVDAASSKTPLVLKGSDESRVNAEKKQLRREDGASADVASAKGLKETMSMERDGLAKKGSLKTTAVNKQSDSNAFLASLKGPQADLTATSSMQKNSDTNPSVNSVAAAVTNSNPLQGALKSSNSHHRRRLTELIHLEGSEHQDKKKNKMPSSSSLPHDSNWISIPPNDEFFSRFPEWKEEQERIYRNRYSGEERDDASSPSSSSSQRQRMVQSTSFTPNTEHSRLGPIPRN